MRNFKSFTVLMIILSVLASFSCKNSESTSIKNEELRIICAIKTPIVRGAGGGGMKIMLNLKKQEVAKLDSIVYNGRASRIDEIKKMKEGIWYESFFYNEEQTIRGKGLVQYKAEGNSCQLYYTVRNKSKSIIVSSLELKQDTTLWE